MAKRVSVINFKGGVGKTTLAFELAAGLVRYHTPAKVLVDHTQHLASLQRYWKSELVEPYIEAGTGVSQALADGVPVYDRANNQNVGGRGFHTMYKRLTDALKTRIDAL